MPAKRWLWTGYTTFWLLLIVYLRLFKPWRMQNKPYRVTEVRRERSNSWILALEPDGHQGMCFKPGQFAWLTLRDSPWQVREHPFSFSSSASHPDRLEFTIRQLGDFTSTIKQTRIGEVAYLDGPYGVFSVDQYPDAAGFVFIAGGVGIAPIISMLRTLADRHAHQPLWLIYGNKCWDSVIFREELDTLQQHLDLQLVHVLQQPPDDWKGESGFITTELLQKVLPHEKQKIEYFLCGPGPMADAVQRGLRSLQVPQTQIHFELSIWFSKAYSCVKNGPDALHSSPGYWCYCWRLYSPLFKTRSKPPDTTQSRERITSSPSEELVTFDAKKIKAGQHVYQQQNCARCHAIAGEGNPRNPLDGIGARRTAEELRDGIIGADTLQGRLPTSLLKLKQSNNVLSDKELDALILYMQSLRNER